MAPRSCVVLLLLCIGEFENRAVCYSDNSPSSITLSNGDVISGDIISESAERVVLRNPVLGNLEIPCNAIAGIRSHELAEQSSIAASSPQMQSANTTSTSSGLVLSKLKVAAAILDATQKQQTYGGEIDITRNTQTSRKGWPRQRSLLMLSPSFDDKRNPAKPPAIITRNYNAIFQHLFYTSSDDLYVPVLANWYHNNSLGIYLQQTYGAGIGKTVGSLELNADLRFIGEHFYTAPNSSAPVPSLGLIGMGLSERYDLSLDPLRPGAKLTEHLEFVPVFNHVSAWQGHGIVEVSVPFAKQLSLVISAFDNYVENAPPTFNKNYFKTTVGVQYSPAPKK